MKYLDKQCLCLEHNGVGYLEKQCLCLEHTVWIFRKTMSLLEHNGMDYLENNVVV